MADLTELETFSSLTTDDRAYTALRNMTVEEVLRYVNRSDPQVRVLAEIIERNPKVFNIKR